MEGLWNEMTRNVAVLKSAHASLPFFYFQMSTVCLLSAQVKAMKSRLTVEGEDKVVPVQIMMAGIRGWGWGGKYSPLIRNLGNRWGE